MSNGGYVFRGNKFVFVEETRSMDKIMRDLTAALPQDMDEFITIEDITPDETLLPEDFEVPEEERQQCPFCPLWFGLDPSLWNAIQGVSVQGIECCAPCEKTLSGMPQDEQDEYVVLAHKAQEAVR